MMPRQGEKKPRRVPRMRKVYYAYYDNEFDEPYPVIRLGGRYLEAYGFMVGNSIEVQYEVGRITIVRAEQPDAV